MCGRSWEPITELNYVEYQTHPSLVRARTHLPRPTAVFGAASTPGSQQPRLEPDDTTQLGRSSRGWLVATTTQQAVAAAAAALTARGPLRGVSEPCPSRYSTRRSAGTRRSWRSRRSRRCSRARTHLSLCATAHPLYASFH